MIGVEMVKNRDENLDPMGPDMFGDIFEKTKDYGILFGKGGRYGNVFRIQPPMCLNAHDVEFALSAFEKSIQESI
jgi:alanine-glyoxylate transaminase/(R)-3-amino-2-methylpropionate-pyruvate transaminase